MTFLSLWYKFTLWIFQKQITKLPEDTTGLEIRWFFDTVIAILLDKTITESDLEDFSEEAKSGILRGLKFRQQD